MLIKKLLPIFTLLTLSQLSYAAATDGAAWGYQGNIGPLNWGNLDPAYQQCSIGKTQSPINITQAQFSQDNKLSIHYPTTTAETSYDEVTELDLHGKKIVYNDGHTLQIKFPAISPEYIKVAGQQYQLVQFHVHTPSENLINNQQFPIEIHFVNQAKNGDAAVLSVMFVPGKFNAGLQKLLDQLPASKQKLAAHQKVTVQVADLLPQDKTYYTFEGSLTTPPCSGGLTWFVFAKPAQASAAQIQQLQSFLPTTGNARPVQPLNGRQITTVQP